MISLLLNSCTSKQEKIELFTQKGIENIHKGDNNSAIEDLTKVIKLQKDYFEAYYYRANAKFNLKQAKEALIDYNKAIEIKSDYADAYYNRGFCKQFIGDLTGACADWDQAEKLGKPNVKDMLNKCK